ncbi:MAG: DNA polymerase III subunit beta [Candidatus Peribacteraceae bacterium]|nr:DNA polymerase III subunit beta [Candidatus Peribacteraceae bacterium]
MKFSCSTSDLLQSLQLVARAIGSQQALPILGNILIEAQGRRCTVSATDLELSIITSFDAKIENEGSVTVPAKAILNFAQYNNDPEVLLETSEGTILKCTSQHTKSSIAGEAASEYPTIAAVEKQTSFTLPLSPLLHALHLVTFSSTRTSLRPVLSGVYLRSEKNMVILVATDSYRLSEYKIAASVGTADIACIIPTKILEELKVMLSAKKGKEGKEDMKKKKDEGVKDEDVSIILSKQQIELQCGPTRLLSRLIDGKFPNYEQILPKETATTVHFSVQELTTAVKRMHYFAKEVNNNLTFHAGKGQTRVVTPQTPAGRDEALLTTEVSGKDNKIALSSSYLLDFLGHLDSDSINMQMTDSTHPALFILPDEKNYLHLIMPLRMQEE